MQQKRLASGRRSFFREVLVKTRKQSCKAPIMQYRILTERYGCRTADVTCHPSKILHARIQHSVDVAAGCCGVTSVGFVGIDHENLASRRNALSTAIPIGCGTAFNERNHEIIVCVARVSMIDEARMQHLQIM